MKKIFFFLFLPILILAILAVSLFALSDSVQTKIANKISPNFSVEKVSISLSKATLENIKYKNFVSVKKVDASYSLLDIPLKKIKIYGLKLDGVNVNTKNSPKQESPQKDSPKAIEKTKKRQSLSFPFAVDLDELTANVKIDDKDFSISAKKISTAENLKPKNGFAEISTNGAILKTSIKTEKNEVAIKSLLETDSKKVFQLSAELPQDYSKILVKARLDATDELVATFVPKTLALPKFSVALYAEIKSHQNFQSLSIDVSGLSKISNLEKISPLLAHIGDTSISTKIQIVKTAEKIKISQFDINFAEGKTGILELTSKPFIAKNVADLENLELLATVSIPPRLVEGFLPNLKIESDNICTKMSLKKNGKNLLFATTSPVSFTNLKISRSDELIAHGFNLFTDLKANIGENSRAEFDITAVDSTAKKSTIKAFIDIDKNKSAKIKLTGSGDLNPIISNINSMSSITALDLKFDLIANANFSNKILSADNLSISIIDAQSDNKATVKSASKISYNMESGEIKTASSELFSIDAPAFPIALLKPFFPEFDAQSTSLVATISSPKKDNYSAKFSTSVKSLSYKKDGKYIEHNTSISLNGTALYDTTKLQVEIDKGTLGKGEASYGVFDGSLLFDIPTNKISSLNINALTALPQLLNRPILSKYANVSRGTADINASYNGESLSANVKIHTLSSPTSSTITDTLNARIKTDFNNYDLDCDVYSTYGKSKAKARIENADTSLKIILDSSSIVLEDLQNIIAVFSHKDNTPTTTSKPPTVGKSQRIYKPNLEVLAKESKSDSIAKRDTKAFWDIDKTLAINANVSKLISNRSIMLENLIFDVTATNEKFYVSRFSCSPFGSNMTGAISITFDASRTIPYILSPSEISVKSFEASNIFQDEDNPMISGIFDVTLKVSGKGNNAEHLCKYLVGNATIKSQTDGVIRLLDSNKILGKGVSLASGIFKLTGRLLDNRIKELDSLSDVIAIFAKTNFTNAQIHLSRNDKDFNYNIDFAEIKTDSILFTTESGKIFFDPTARKFGDQKLFIPIKTYATGSTKQLFEKIGYSKTENEKLKGYFSGPDFNIEGTVSSPTNNLLNILNGAKNAVGNIINQINFFK